MACACKVNRYLEDVNKKYSNPHKVIKTDIRSKINIFFKKFLICLLIIPFIPLMFIYILITRIMGKKNFSLNKIINRNKNVRK